MKDATGSSDLTDLAKALASSDVGRSVAAAYRAFEGGAKPVDIIRVAARVAAGHDDPTSAAAPRGLAMLGAAANLRSVLQPRFHPLPILQALAYLASEKRTPSEATPPFIVSGEITHLGRSFLFAVREGDLREAESIFLGIVDEGSERKMAGDMLFRAAIEDMGEGGRKLFIAVKSWELARALEFKEVRRILRPAVRFLVRGPRDRSRFEAILGILGKEWVDLEALASGGRSLDDAGRGKVRAALTSASDAECVASTLRLLNEGYAATSVAEAFIIEAARRIVAASGYDAEVARGLLFAHAARFVLTFSRTSERLYVLFQAALRLRSPEPVQLPDAPLKVADEGEELCHLAAEFDARKPRDAAVRARAYVAHGYSGPRLLEVLANYACRDAPLTNAGINVFLADACASEFLVTKAPEVPMALAKMIAASPKDQAAYSSWLKLLGP